MRGRNCNAWRSSGLFQLAEESLRFCGIGVAPGGFLRLSWRDFFQDRQTKTRTSGCCRVLSDSSVKNRDSRGGGAVFLSAGLLSGPRSDSRQAAEIMAPHTGPGLQTEDLQGGFGSGPGSRVPAGPPEGPASRWGSRRRHGWRPRASD